MVYHFHQTAGSVLDYKTFFMHGGYREGVFTG